MHHLQKLSLHQQEIKRNRHHSTGHAVPLRCDLSGVGEDYCFNTWLMKYLLPKQESLVVRLSLFLSGSLRVWVAPNTAQFPAILSRLALKCLIAGCLSISVALFILDPFACLSVSHSINQPTYMRRLELHQTCRSCRYKSSMRVNHRCRTWLLSWTSVPLFRRCSDIAARRIRFYKVVISVFFFHVFVCNKNKCVITIPAEI